MSAPHSLETDDARFAGEALFGDGRSATHEATIAALKAALLREEELRGKTRDLVKRQELLTQEFEHRLANSIQLIVSLLTMQRRNAPTADVAAQLDLAANRVSAIGRVHRRLHLLDNEQSVELKAYLEGLCDDLANMLLADRGEGPALKVTGAQVRLSSALGIPLGFIVNELIVNAVKYARGHIVLHIETAGAVHALSVSDDGPGFPPDFDPVASCGLGMKIIRSLVTQIAGTLHFTAADSSRGGARVTVSFPAASMA